MHVEEEDVFTCKKKNEHLFYHFFPLTHNDLFFLVANHHYLHPPLYNLMKYILSVSAFRKKMHFYYTTTKSGNSYWQINNNI